MTTASGFSVRPLPFYLRATNVAGDWFDGGPECLDPDRLMSDAARAAGLPPDFPRHVHEALHVLCASLRDEARLHWFGRAYQYNLLITGLSSLLQVERAFRDVPSLAATPLVPPLIVTGLPRSGTTHLHRLLSAVAGAEPVRMYQHMLPVRRRPLDTRWPEVAVKFLPWHLASRAYGMDAMHHVRPGLPDECNFGMRLSGRSMIFWAMAPAYSYLRWLLAQDLRETYHLYRKVLILHQLATPGRRLTLKCPHHLASLPALREALPEALIVQIHRDPVEVVPSECKLVLSLQSISTSEIDWVRTVEGNTGKVRTFADRAVAFAPQDGAPIAHVRYAALVRDPVGTVAQLHADLALPFEEADRAAVTAFALKNPQNKHGRNRYSAEQFGLSQRALLKDFAPYRARFLGAED